MTRAHAVATLAWIALTTLAVAGCSVASSNAIDVPTDGKIPLGTWGGVDGGLIVGDTAMHLHVGCTFGDVSGRVSVDAAGRFDVAGSYVLRAYPIAIGPSLPARFTGRLAGSTLTISATVDDTVEHVTVVRGPVTLTLGREPQMANCPICRRPELRAHRR